MNAETNRLKERLLSIKNTNSNNSVERIKKEQISEIYKKYLKEEINNYEKKVFNGSIIDVEKIEIKLEFVENQSQERLFEYYRNVVSSVPQYNIPGRQLKILVKDNNSHKYLGLIQLTVDLLVNDKKNIFLGVEEKDYGKYKKVIRDCGVNIVYVFHYSRLDLIFVVVNYCYVAFSKKYMTTTIINIIKNSIYYDDINKW